MNTSTLVVFAGLYALIAILLIGVPFAAVFYTACSSFAAMKAMRATPVISMSRRTAFGLAR